MIIGNAQVNGSITAFLYENGAFKGIAAPNAKELDSVRRSFMRRFTVMLTGTIFAFAFTTSQFLFSQVWVGSTGAPANPSRVTLNGAAAYVPASLTSGTAVLHYSVLPVRDLAQPLAPGTCRQLFVRYLDNGPDARVTVELKQLKVFTGAVSTLLTFDSNAQPTTSNTAFLEGTTSCFAFDFNWADTQDNALGLASSAYYFEVKLQKSASDGVAAVREFHLVTFVP